MTLHGVRSKSRGLSRFLWSVESHILRRPLAWSVAAVLGLSLAVNLGSFHRHHHGDSIVPILVSLERWTPFYWEQGRFGMLVPALALPVRHPLANLIVQNTLTCAFAFAGFFAAARLWLGRAWFGVAALCIPALIAFTGVLTRFEYLNTAQPFGTSLGLTLLGLLGMDRRPRWWPLWALLLVLAMWVTPTSFFAAAPAVCFNIAIARRAAGRALATLGFLVAAFLASTAASQQAGEVHGIALPATWWPTFLAMWTDSERYRERGIALVLAIGMLHAAVRASRAPKAARWRGATLVIAASASAFGFACNTKVLNGPSGRYLLPSLALLLPLVGRAALDLARESARRRRARLPWRGLSLGIALLAVFLAYGLPSLDGVHRDIDETLGTYTEDLIATRTTHFVGSYWRVWPAVFHFQMTLYERGGSARLFGITHRSRPTADLWLTAPAWRVAAARTEDEILWWARGYGLPFLAPRGVIGSIVVLDFVEGERAPSGFPTPQRRVAGMED